MMLMPNETVLSGAWISMGGTIRGDDVCMRIEWLVDNALVKVASSPQSGDWETLFRDPADNRFWERTYPNGDLHGGGAPRLDVISIADAKMKYQF